jgi:hypothetical protein
MPNTTPATDLIQQLVVRLEHAWNTSHDDRLVDRLAAEHPSFAEELYDFFADLVEAELERDHPCPELEAADERTRQWLEREGYRNVAEARRLDAIGRTPTLGSAGLSSGLSPATQSVAWPANIANDRELGAPRPFLGLLKEATSKPTAALAVALELTAGFLVDISDNADLLPDAARAELAHRAEKAWGLDRRRSLAALATVDHQFQKAASREGPYEGHRVTYAEVVARSGMNSQQKRYWLLLA